MQIGNINSGNYDSVADSSRERNLPVTVSDRKYNSPDEATDALRDRTIASQMKAISELGRSAESGSLAAEKVLEQIADNDFDQFNPAVQSAASDVLQKYDLSDNEEDEEDDDIVGREYP